MFRTLLHIKSNGCAFILKDRQGRPFRHPATNTERGREDAKLIPDEAGRKFRRQNTPLRLHLRRIIVHDDALLAGVGS